MIDSYELLRSKIESSDIVARMQLNAHSFGVVTLHRPSNVDNCETLAAMITQLRKVSELLPLVFPIHPRTRGRLQDFGLWKSAIRDTCIRFLEPLGYVEFMSLIKNARVAITDSGGIQEETTYLGIPCITLRDNTERPITITQGTNRLAKTETLVDSVRAVLNDSMRDRARLELWDGQAAKRAVQCLRTRSGIPQTSAL
jgi:UDP-N-acetylglucosamine 2-epimerase (non-hydrolysing)